MVYDYWQVYDMSDNDSFSYVRFMRDQILTHRAAHSQHDLPPIIVAANKADLQASSLSIGALKMTDMKMQDMFVVSE